MPSLALSQFETNMLKDVNNLLETHAYLSSNRRGRRGLGFLTRSGVFMLCAAWELYIEQLLLESVEFLCSQHSDPKDFPKEIQKVFADYVKTHKHDLKPLDLIGDGWRTCYIEHANQYIDRLNTPKIELVNNLFKKFLNLEDLSTKWANSWDIDKLVIERGDIAHKGSAAKYVKITSLESYIGDVINAVRDTDKIVAKHLKSITPRKRLPWKQGGRFRTRP